MALSEKGKNRNDAGKENRRYSVHVSPFVHQYGEIVVPESVMTQCEEEVEKYIRKNFGNIRFSEPSFSCKGVDIDFEDADDE